MHRRCQSRSPHIRALAERAGSGTWGRRGRQWGAGAPPRAWSLAPLRPPGGLRGGAIHRRAHNVAAKELGDLGPQGLRQPDPRVEAPRRPHDRRDRSAQPRSSSTPSWRATPRATRSSRGGHARHVSGTQRASAKHKAVEAVQIERAGAPVPGRPVRRVSSGQLAPGPRDRRRDGPRDRSRRAAETGAIARARGGRKLDRQRRRVLRENVLDDVSVR